MVKNLPAVWETCVWSLGWKDCLEEVMAIHSSILAWRIPMDRGAWWATVFVGLPRVGHDWATKKQHSMVLHPRVQLTVLHSTVVCIYWKKSVHNCTHIVLPVLFKNHFYFKIWDPWAMFFKGILGGLSISYEIGQTWIKCIVKPGSFALCAVGQNACNRPKGLQ